MKSDAMYRKTYSLIMDVLKPFSLDSNAGKEVQLYLHYVSVISAPHHYQSFVPAPSSYTDMDLIERRMRLYISTPPEKVRAEWLMAEKPEHDTNPLLHTFLIFGDLLWNVNARNNYASAPFMIHDFSMAIEFAMVMMRRVFPIVTDYASYLLRYESDFSQKPSLGKNLAVIVGVLLTIFALFFGLSLLKPYIPPSPVSKSHVVTTATPSPSPYYAAVTKSPPPVFDDLVRLYASRYPRTWAYIKKYAEDPESYLHTYHEIWGPLQKDFGDGIPFDTLTKQQIALINYPAINSYIYLVSSSADTYHSTEDCYTLLNSGELITLRAHYRSQYDPCSKCVGE